MIDQLKLMAKLYRAYILFATGIIVLIIFGIWLFRGYERNANIGKTIDAIKTTAQTNERRADTIIDATKHKEEEIRHETTEKITAAGDNALPDLLAGLLADYRKQH